MIRAILQFFAQKKCLGCNRAGHFFCQQCLQSLYEYAPYCYACKGSSQNFLIHDACYSAGFPNAVHVLSRYRQRSLKKAILQAKFYNRYYLYESLLLRSWKALENDFLTDCLLIPVPSHYFRSLIRGGDHTLEITKILSKKLGIPYKNDILSKSKHVKQQSMLSLAERKNFPKNVFKAKYIQKYKNHSLYLVDDVVSSGTTLQQCVVALKKVGYTDVRAICLASD